MQGWCDRHGGNVRQQQRQRQEELCQQEPQRSHQGAVGSQVQYTVIDSMPCRLLVVVSSLLLLVVVVVALCRMLWLVLHVVD